MNISSSEDDIKNQASAYSLKTAIYSCMLHFFILTLLNQSNVAQLFTGQHLCTAFLFQ